MVVCLLNDAPPDYLRAPLLGRTTIERTVGYVERLRERLQIERVILASTSSVPDVPPDWEQHALSGFTEHNLTDLLAGLTADAGTELLLAFFDQPFLNDELTDRMIDRHRDYRAEYTFADGYPAGLAPEIITGRAVAHLRTLARPGAPIERAGLFPIVARDINRLDVETVLSESDQRLLRLSLSVDTRANLLVCQRLAEGAPSAIDEWPEYAESRRLIHRSAPRFVSIQVIEQEVQRLAYSPYPQVRENLLEPGLVMDVGRFSTLVSEVARFSPEAFVHVSEWGEIALHPEPVALVRAVLAQPRLRVLVETSGVGWSREARAELFGIGDPRLLLIVGLDSDDEDTYRRVRGDGYNESHAFATEAIERLGSRAHVQAVRSELTEPHLDAFYRAWKERTPNVIIEKYDHFCGRLPQLKIGDISPLDRFPCWHLQRDLVVRVDGSVPLCREDVMLDHALGNVFDAGLETVWAAGNARYAEHVDGRYRGICEQCDEFYTFTF